MSNPYPPAPGDPFSSSSHQSPPMGPPDRPSNSKTPWIIGGLVGFGIMCLVCCGGITMLAKVGLDMVSEDIKRQVREEPTIQENIGEIESMSMNLIASGSHDDDETFVYDLKGSLGSGELTVRSITNDSGGESIESASLKTSDGRTFELDLP